MNEICITGWKIRSLKKQHYSNSCFMEMMLAIFSQKQKVWLIQVHIGKFESVSIEMVISICDFKNWIETLLLHFLATEFKWQQEMFQYTPKFKTCNHVNWIHLLHALDSISMGCNLPIVQHISWIWLVPEIWSSEMQAHPITAVHTPSPFCLPQMASIARCWSHPIDQTWSINDK